MNYSNDERELIEKTLIFENILRYLRKLAQQGKLIYKGEKVYELDIYQIQELRTRLNPDLNYLYDLLFQLSNGVNFATIY